MTLSQKIKTTKRTTDIQDAFMQYWEEYERIYGENPTMSQAMKDLGYKSISGIQRHLLALEKKGLMARAKHRYWYVVKNV